MVDDNNRGTLQMINRNGGIGVALPLSVDDRNRKGNLFPSNLKLNVYPNPLNSSTTIRYSTGSAPRTTRLAIYDLSGREVAELPTVSSPQLTVQEKAVGYGDPTVGSVVWDASLIPAEIYFVRLESRREVVSKKVVLMK